MTGAAADARNLRALRLLECLGFRQEGELRDGVWFKGNAFRKFGVPGKSAGIWLRRRALRAARLTAQPETASDAPSPAWGDEVGLAPAVTGRGRCGFPRRRAGSRSSRISAEIRSVNFRMALGLAVVPPNADTALGLGLDVTCHAVHIESCDHGSHREKRREPGDIADQLQSAWRGASPMSDGTEDTPLAIVNPPELGKPRGFAHGVLAPAGGRVLFVAGQTATDSEGRVTRGTFFEQFDVALTRVLAVVRAAGGQPQHVARMTVFVTSMESYRESRPALRDVWRRHMGSHRPAMAAVQVTTLVDEGAAVEIEATAVLP
jgi:enamine deaminase RidA (YjgF/YER057c/UK114 family)